MRAWGRCGQRGLDLGRGSFLLTGLGGSVLQAQVSKS